VTMDMRTTLLKRAECWHAVRLSYWTLFLCSKYHICLISLHCSEDIWSYVFGTWRSV
jgi:hypothetical protein